MKWVLTYEPYARESEKLLEAHQTGKVHLFAPDFLWAEVANVLWKAARRRRISSQLAETNLHDLSLMVAISTIPCATLREDALAIALTHNRSVYDSMYLALAINTNQPLITADEKLVRAVASRFPVEWLGAFSS